MAGPACQVYIRFIMCQGEHHGEYRKKLAIEMARNALDYFTGEPVNAIGQDFDSLIISHFPMPLDKKEDNPMPRTNIFDMPFPKVYGALVNKAEKKGRTKAEVDEITRWLTGYSDLEELDGKTYGEFIEGAPSWNPHAELITGKICGVQVETIEDPAMKKVRQLDKLVDELAKGRAMEKIKR